MDTAFLKSKSRAIRLESLERSVAAGKGHLGGTFSCVDLLSALYYGGILRVDAARPRWPDRDRLILSKGHACLALYSILADLGFMTRERMETYGLNGGLGGQLDLSVPGVDWNTGSLGHALGVCAGISLAAKLDGKDFYAYTILGDAELAEGSVWEAIAFAADRQLGNLVGIIDRNRLSVTDVLEDDAIYRNLERTLDGFGWTYVEIDGHSFPAIFTAFETAKASPRPTMIVANTIKGKGVSFMENEVKWHHGVPTRDEIAVARRELA